MTQTYIGIQRKIEALQRQAEKLRAQEMDEVVTRIKVAIDHYGITAAQLGFGTASTNGKSKGPAAPRSAKYSDSQGNAWSGMGKRPYWLRDALNAGRRLEEFAAGASPTSTQSAKPKTSNKKRKSKVVYRDEAGRTWTGMGPRPRWLKEALGSGKTLEEMTA